jgi:predicted  nucleic acid-binding Zn-ribbon protein
MRGGGKGEGAARLAPAVVPVVSIIATLYDLRHQRRDRPMSEDFEFQKRLIHQFSAVLDGMKTLNSNISANIDAIGRFESEFTKLSRQNTQVRGDVLEVRSDFAQFRTDVTHRFDALEHRLESLAQRLEALHHRMEDIENTLDANSEHIRETRIELRSQYNDILTALQGGLQNTTALRDLTERVEALERRAGM